MTQIEKKTLTVDGRVVELGDERNLLELIRRVGINLPTFCYHSDLSIYGACRLCLVDVEKRGIMASCSTAPEAGMVIQTNTEEIRQMRKITIELLLANHNRECPTCEKSNNCSLLTLSRQLGVDTLRYQNRTAKVDIDYSSPSLVRDPNKCILCGDCVRMCSEVQGIGAIDFAFRGSKSCVLPAFNKNLGDVECVNCGQCAQVCPTGALVPHSQRDAVWKAISDPTKTVIAQIAPAVRVAIGEYFGIETGKDCTGLMATALRLMGFDEVYDTSFAADMTILEEANELLGRVKEGGKLPLFTSCCPGWVKFLETYYPDMIGNLSSCKSPQQMFGAVAKKMLPEKLKVERKNLVVVSIMPCTAKKFEAKLEKFTNDGQPDVDFVITTQELGRMILARGIDFKSLEPSSLDMPMGFYTGAGVIFGATGGVMEAALRYAAGVVNGVDGGSLEFKEVRGFAGVKEASYDLGGTEVKIAVAHGLNHVRKLIEAIRSGERSYHFVEIMACPGGCIAGGGQPMLDKVTKAKSKAARAKGLYTSDRVLQLHNSGDNTMVQQAYDKCLHGGVGGHDAHEALHTNYENRCDLLKP